MSENSTLEYFIEGNGHKPDLTQVRDNRLQLLIDGRKVETWEIIVMEETRVKNWLLIFARYIARGDKLISPDLPNKPIDELSASEMETILSSHAYKALKHFTLPQLKAAAQSFAEQALNFTNDPN